MKAKSKRKPSKAKVAGQVSWRLATSEVEAYITEVGGHLGPVTFDRKGKCIQPYSVAPWAEEKIDPSFPVLLRVLRGDFFCLPFGANTKPYRGEQHPIHGETANGRWRFEAYRSERDQQRLQLSLETRQRSGRVEKEIVLRPGHQAVYCRHRITGMVGPMNFGHHAMIRFPDRPGSGIVSTSAFLHGQVLPVPFELPEQGGYSWLQPGSEFISLEAVGNLTGNTSDLSRFPARRGFEDLVMVAHETETLFAWTAVSFPKERYVWFALKNPRLLRETIFWLSNGGRHYPPWNGRHVNVMGIEDVTSYFHLGLAESVRANPLRQKGYATCFQLRGAPVTIPYIMGIARIPPGFDKVAAIERVNEEEKIRLIASRGKAVEARVDWKWLAG